MPLQMLILKARDVVTGARIRGDPAARTIRGVDDVNYRSVESVVRVCTAEGRDTA